MPLINDLVVRYEARRQEFLQILYPYERGISATIKEFIKPKDFPKIEDTFELDRDFYRSIEADIIAMQGLAGEHILLEEWEEIAHVLRVNNERLSGQIDNMAVTSALFAIITGILILLEKNTFLSHWSLIIIGIYFGIRMMISRSNKRPELARNKELLIILERYIKNHQNV